MVHAFPEMKAKVVLAAISMVFKTTISIETTNSVLLASLHFRQEKAHKHKLSGPVALGATPGMSRGQTGFVPGLRVYVPSSLPSEVGDHL